MGAPQPTPTIVNPQDDQPPRANLRGLRDHWRNDLIAGFSVALVALPLALGIATAAGAPPISGLVSAVVAGLVATFLRGSHIAINGPGNSLIVIVAGAIAALGGPEAFPDVLGAIVVAGALQAGFGMLRLGKLGDLIPPAVVQGLLAAIGLMIIGKQAHVLVGRSAPEGSALDVLRAVPESLLNLHPAAATIGLVSFAILLLHPRTNSKLLKFVPAPLWVVGSAIPLAMLAEHYGPAFGDAVGRSAVLTPAMFVELPGDVIASLVRPRFHALGSTQFWMAVVTLCLVTSIENIVSVKAVDKLDAYRRKSSMDRDLVGMGLATIASAFAGGLPISTVIARSSVNVNHGAHTGWSNLFHGALLLLFVALLGPVIELTPLAALAALLVYTGYKLCSPLVVKDALSRGPDHFVVFGITLTATLVAGLLWGLAVGIAAELVSHMVILGLRPRDTLRRICGLRIEQLPGERADAPLQLRVHGVANFLTVPRFRRALSKLPHDGLAVLDFAPAILIDGTVLEYVHDSVRRQGRRGGLPRLQVAGLESHRPLSDHPNALHAQERKLYALRLTQRQQRLAALARTRGWSFDARRDWEPSDLDEFHFFRWHPVEFRESIIRGSFEVEGQSLGLVVSDVTFEEGAMLSDVFHTTTLQIRLPFTIPEFVLEREEFLDRALELAGFQDIDFRHFTTFSKRFVVKGRDEAAIRRFLQPPRMRLFERDPVYHVESSGPEIVFFDNYHRLASAAEVEAMVAFAEDLARQLVRWGANEEAASGQQ